ncbi:sensor histidine kinase [Foetidibacter luteolus]|uniref:sensor histidine kinase n=1 Tax=Foetidibacter luteolus TaxID=2608880 RepID=UPI00129B6218|nr:histidine kinase [Foetidibacter luteolus]
MLKANQGQSWLVKYKLYHIPFWLLYHYVWWTVAVGNPLKAASSMFYPPLTIKFLFYLVFQALAAYFNLYYLIPKYLEKARFGAYMAWLAATVMVTSLCIVSGYYFSAFVFNSSIQQVFGANACFNFFLGNALPSTCAIITLTMSIKLTKKWLHTKKRQQLLEKEKLETELKFLRNQFNPHFLFNTINSIFFLIHKDPGMASSSLAKFSDLLRYQLYECNDVQIPLTKELAYLNNYIELEKLRQSNYINICSNIEELGAGAFTIAPFIIMPFVENAFKHVSRNGDKSDWINIQLQLSETCLDFRIANSKASVETKDLLGHGGIGLQNVQRRLELIYPGKHELDIINGGDSFEVELHIELSKNFIPHLQTTPVITTKNKMPV